MLSSERKSKQLQMPRQSRRSFMLSAGAAAVGAAVFPQEAGYWVGKAVDVVRNPEQLLPSYGLTIIEPREHDTPKVAPERRARSFQETTAVVARDAQKISLSLDRVAGCSGAHSKEALHATDFSIVGCGVVTTAEGLSQGQQEFCLLGIAQNGAVLAVGYETGGCYTFNNTIHEWEAVYAEQSADQVRQLAAPNAWEEVQKIYPVLDTKPFIAFLDAGNKLYTHLGYKPFGAVKSSTRMPDMSRFLHINGDTVADTREKALDPDNNPYLITESGILLDTLHLKDKAFYVTSLIAQLRLISNQRTSGKKQDTYHLSVAFGSPAGTEKDRIEFSIADSLFEKYTLTDICQMVFCTYTTATEGISQQDIYNAARKVKLNTMYSTGYSAEDHFTNTLSAQVCMLLLENKVSHFAELDEAIAAFAHSDQAIDVKTAAKADLLAYELWNKQKDIGELVVAWVVDNWGLSNFSGEITELPHGYYHAIGTQVVETNTPIPRLPLGSLPDSTDGVVVTKLPDFSSSLSRAAQIIQEKVHSLFIGKNNSTS